VVKGVEGLVERPDVLTVDPPDPLATGGRYRLFDAVLLFESRRGSVEAEEGEDVRICR
jgi:hypothetical protein